MASVTREEVCKAKIARAQKSLKSVKLQGRSKGARYIKAEKVGYWKSKIAHLEAKLEEVQNGR